MTAATLLRFLALGAASGLRSTAAPTAVYAGRGAWPVLAVMALGEAIVDKLPAAPSRTQPGALAARAFAAATAARGYAERTGADALPGALLAVPAALAAAFAGRRYRAIVAERGLPDLPAALIEDAAAFGVAFAAANDSQSNGF